MSTLLQQLYNGEISPAEQFRPLLKEHIQKRDKNYKKYEAFIQRLEFPPDQEFIQIMDEHLDACSLELTQTFIDGFKLGAKIVIEVYEDRP